MTTKLAASPNRSRDERSASAAYPGSVHLATDLPSHRAAMLRRWTMNPVFVVAGLLLIVGLLAVSNRRPDLPTFAGATASPTIAPTSTPVNDIDTQPVDTGALGESPLDELDGDEPPASTEEGSDGLDLDPAAGEEATASLDTVQISRFVDSPTTRVLDTRADDGAPLGPGESTIVDLSPYIGSDATAVALSVGVAMAQGPGAVTVALDGTPVTALTVGSPMSSNLVFVTRVSGDELTVSTEGGGHVVIDVIGHFEPSGPTASGRFVALGPERIAHLVTATDGRQATISPSDESSLPTTGVGSVLVRIVADVGSDGGRVRLGPATDDLTNTMMWGPSTDDDRTRSGVAVVALDDSGQLAFEYDGGTVLDVDLLGYFTDESAPVSGAGLYVPIEPTVVFEGDVLGQSTSIVPVDALLGATGAVEAVAITVNGTGAEAGDLVTFDGDSGLVGSATVALGGDEARNGSSVVPLDGRGLLSIFSEVDAQVTVVATGYFQAVDE